MVDQLIVTFAICTLFVYFWLRKGNNRLPPGPIRLPVLGSVIQLHQYNAYKPHLALNKLAEKYGDIVSFGLGMYTAVVVSSFEVMQKLFKKMETNSYRFEMTYVPDRNFGQNLGIVFCHGQKWVDVRRFTKKILKEFGYGKMKHMDESLKESANQLVDYIKMELLDSSDGTFLVDQKKFSVHVLNIIWNLVGGYKFNPNDENLKRNMECIDQIEEIMGHLNPYNVFPFLKTWFPKQVKYDEHLKIHKEIHEFTESLITNAKDKRNERLDSEPTSFIEVFLDKIEENNEDPDTIFTNEQLVIILEDLFLGGLVTTGTLLSWSILFLVLNPDVQVKLRREILNKMKNRSDLLQVIELKKCVQKVPYVKATVLEIMRLGNIIPIPVPRCPIEDVEIGDYTIPKGSVLFYNLYAMFNDEMFWKDPKIFRPERFLTENGEIDKIHSERILNAIFGVGPRACFGEEVGTDAIFMFLAGMVVNFQFETLPGQKISAEPVNGIVLAPEKFSVKITTPST